MLMAMSISITKARKGLGYQRIISDAIFSAAHWETFADAQLVDEPSGMFQEIHAQSETGRYGMTAARNQSCRPTCQHN